VLIALAAVITGVALLATAGSALAVVLDALLAAAGLDLTVTSALRHRPLYQKPGYLPPSLRSSR
jgi:hypothetical protein